MKIIFRLLSLGLWFVVFIITIAGISIVIENKFNIPTIIIFLVIISILIVISLLLWDKSTKFNKKQIQTENSNECLQSDDVNFNFSARTIPDVTTREVPSEILRDMNMFYTSVQLENDLRILQESIDLMKSTNNIETFLSRSDLAQRTSLTIEQAIMAGIHVKEIFTSSKDILNLKTVLLPKLLNESYSKMKKDAFKLKTEKGRIGRFQKYLELLEEHEYDLDISENYEDIIHVVRHEINQLSHSYK
ncbi:hypothetical protein [Lysinibacillus sp. NPDC047702]|uniref:hypothetical protein n=1 Tax=unclassified Lysinibacillus TaxID=2636778 RepID=UPI003D074122